MGCFDLLPALLIPPLGAGVQPERSEGRHHFARYVACETGPVAGRGPVTFAISCKRSLFLPLASAAKNANIGTRLNIVLVIKIEKTKVKNSKSKDDNDTI